jgi:4-amino-4-deoxy-L-arabinose transferase-like glycosyltransferase
VSNTTRSRSKGRRPDRGRPQPAAPAPAPRRAALLERILNASPWKVALALAVVHLALAILAFNPTPHIGGDNAAYVALAKSLVERHAYLELWDPAARPHTQYPPVWPGMIALLSLLGLHGWFVLKCTVMAFSFVCIGLAYLWLRRTSTPGIALAAGFVLAISPGVLEQAHWELSDVPAWAFTLLALWASTHLVGAPESEGEAGRERHHGRWLALLIVSVVLGNFTRAAGLPLVVAAAAWLGWRRKWRDLALLLAVFLPLAFAWWLRGRLYGAPGYLGHLWAIDPYRPALGNIGPVEMVQRMAANLLRYQGMHLPILLTWNGENRWMLGGVVMVLAAAGWGRRLGRPGLAEFWVPVYLLLLLIWPATWSGERFILPLYPLLLCYGAEALRAGFEAMKKPRAALLAPAVAAVFLVLLAVPGIVRSAEIGSMCTREYLHGDRYRCMTDEYHDFMTVAEMARGKLPPGSAVLSRKATLFYAIAGYPGRTYPMSARTDTFFAAAREAGARYVVFDRIPDLAPLYLHPVLLAARDQFCVLKGLSLENAAVMRLEPDAPTRTGVAENAFRVCDAPWQPPARPPAAPAPVPMPAPPPPALPAP